MFGKPLVMFLVKTPVTPNMVTVFNLLIIFPLVCFANVKKYYYLLALLVQVYMFLDVVDGNLARNKNMKSELGRKLDIFADTLFYTVGLFFIGCGLEMPIWCVLGWIVVQQIYGFTATYYIVPRIRKLEEFKHTKLKAFFIEKDILFGMDASLECLIISIFLLLPCRQLTVIICPILWLVDLVYRLYELKIVNG